LHDKIVSILDFWKEWGDEKEVINYVNKEIQNDVILLEFIRRLVRKSTVQEFGKFNQKIENNISMNEVSEFIDLNLLKDRIENISEDLNNEYMDFIKFLMKEMEKQKINKNDLKNMESKTT